MYFIHWTEFLKHHFCVLKKHASVTCRVIFQWDRRQIQISYMINVSVITFNETVDQLILAVLVIGRILYIVIAVYLMEFNRFWTKLDCTIVPNNKLQVTIEMSIHIYTKSVNLFMGKYTFRLVTSLLICQKELSRVNLLWQYQSELHRVEHWAFRYELQYLSTTLRRYGCLSSILNIIYLHWN